MVLDHEFPPDVRVENELEALAVKGHQVHLASLTRKKLPSLDKFGKAVIHRKYISKFRLKTSVGALKFPFYFNFWRRYLNELFAKEHFDAIHIHDLPLAAVGFEISRKYNVKFVLDLHENWPVLLELSDHTQTFLGKLLSSYEQWKKYEVEFCNKADHVVVVVEEAKDRLVKLGIPKEKITVVSNTLNFNQFKVPDKSPDPDYFTAIYSGGINRHRGLQYVIKGLKYLKKAPKPFRLWILGAGSYVEELKHLARKEGVEQMVTFFGWQPFDEMQKYFALADLFLIPHSKSEHTDNTIPHKIFQYMYAKKPIVSSNCAPLVRIITEAKAGLVYQYDDPQDFSDKVKMLMKGEVKDRIDVDFAYQLVLEKYNWEKDSGRLLKIYEN